jgi:small-conductance mechanosensitive channel
VLPDLAAAVGSVPYLVELILTLVLWTVALAFVRFNKRLFSKVGNELIASNVDDRSLKQLDQIMDFLTVIVAIFITLAIWGVDQMLYAALTTIGIVGVMLGFAVKDIASNFISGIMLILSKDLLIGDAIAVNGVEGTIEKITIRTTIVRRYDGALALVPNSTIVNNVVVDFSATERRRVEVPVVLSANVDVGLVTKLLREVAEGEPRRLDGEEVTVLIQRFEPSTVTLELRFWVKRADLLAVKSDTHDRIQRAFWDRGLTLDISTSIELVGAGAPKGNG